MIRGSVGSGAAIAFAAFALLFACSSGGSGGSGSNGGAAGRGGDAATGGFRGGGFAGTGGTAGQSGGADSGPDTGTDAGDASADASGGQGGVEAGGSAGGSDSGIISLGGASSGGSGGLPGCAVAKVSATLAPFDMYLVMDKSAQVGATRWNDITSAVTSFVNAPSAGVGMGLQFFPASSSECDPNMYLPPAVSVQPLPSGSIPSAMNAQTVGGDVPALPAMQAAVQVTTAYAKMSPDHQVSIVLSTTDPAACSSTMSGLSLQASDALMSTPAVTTYVIALGTSNLDQIAQAGGTGQAMVIGSTNVSQQFDDDLIAIRDANCVVDLPSLPDGGTPALDRVNVLYTSAGGSTTVVPRVSSSGGCSTSKGWQYDNVQNPKQILLCPSLCSEARTGGSLDIELGCMTVVGP